MNQILLCVPAILPIAGGMLMLLFHHFGHESIQNKWEEKTLIFYVEGLTLLNSTILMWLIFHGKSEDNFVLFWLYGGLKVMFKLDKMGRVFAFLISFLWPLAVLYSFEYMKEEKRKITFFPTI